MHANLKILLLILYSLFFSQHYSIAQPKQLQQVPGLASTEVFDMLVDHKGFLWIGHNEGISKYDGVSFTNYSNPQQSSLSATGLLEDKHGRIWFYNFTGQIFYIENGRANLLTAYDGKNEPNFPRMGLIKDLLVASTKRGLFVCDINTLKCHYETCATPNEKGTSSLSILKDKVIACSGNDWWYVYTPGKELRRIYFNEHDEELIKENVGTLNVKTFKDTAFLFCNPAFLVYKLIVVNDSLKICGIPHFKYYINTISIENNGYWVNTVKYSVKQPGNSFIKGYDISCSTVDKLGHKFYGSLQKGLLTDLENQNPLKNRCFLPLIKNDVISCLIKSGNRLIIGTINGKLLSYDPVLKKTTQYIEFPPKQNGISYLKMLDKNRLLAGTPTNTFIFNTRNMKIEKTFMYMSVKQADTIDNAIVFATSPGLIVQPEQQNINNFSQWKSGFLKKFKGISETEGQSFKFLGIEQRARAVCCISKTGTIWCAFKNGLYKINNAGIVPVYFNNLPVYATCLTCYDNKIVAGTINNGILIIGDRRINHLSTDDGLLSNIIFHLKIIDNNLWVYNSGLVQIFNLNTLKITNNYQLPGVNDAIITEVDEVKGQPYLANVLGLFKISTVNNNRTDIYLNSLTINGRDTGFVNNIILPHDQNDIQVNLGVPSLINGKDIFIKYRLFTNSNAKWTYSKTGERNFRFGSLMPGNYQFEAIAGRPQTGISSPLLKINFTIAPPWWLRWWAISCMVVFAALFIFGLSRVYYINLLSAQKAEHEKDMAVEKERQRISSDMHDDIGASLSAIKLYAGSVKQSDNLAAGIPHIYEMLNDLSDKTRELIWSLNNIYDSLESLLYFIDSTANKLFENSEIKLIVLLPDNIPDIRIDNNKRQDIFLTSKECIHNILKHSRATEASMRFNIENGYLSIKIYDNGIGLSNSQKGKPAGQGFVNMKKRVQNLDGKMTVETQNGTLINLTFPL